MTFDEKWTQGRVLKILAEGYGPKVSDPLNMDKPEQVIDFKLTPTAWITGTVLSPDGEPLVDADVVVITVTQRNSSHLSLFDGRFSGPGGTRSADNMKTEVDGRFSLAPPEEDYDLVVTHKRGYQVISAGQLLKSNELTLKPWGRIEGNVRRDSNSKKLDRGQERINVEYVNKVKLGDIELHVGNYTVPDDKGNFILECVLPGVMKVVHWVNKDGSESTQSSDYIEVKPGQTTHVKIRG
jgi:hypothetical protein